MRVFFPSEQPESFQFVVIAARYDGEWLFVRHRERDTYEMPGGHIEQDETPLNAAKRELYEESGAVDFALEPICVYGVERAGITTYGILYYTQIICFEELPDYEMLERIFLETMPEKLTYPQIQPLLMEKAEAWKRRNEHI